ncbi:hypothetical protein ACO0LO_22245 [Undibacterium sp. TJN25]|uniref:hypothetical protein n=1 Tax=Undibacterium sp. TJN25 TaxID=3413056 RepID=UPI003BF1AB93
MMLLLTLERLFALIVAATISGCASYQIATTTDFTDAAKKLTDTVKSVDDKNVMAQNTFRKITIAQDDTCQIAGEPIFLRHAEGIANDPSPSHAPLPPTGIFIDGRPSTISLLVNSGKWKAIENSCEALRRCEKNPSYQGCNSICYSEVETGCLLTILELSRQKAFDYGNGTTVTWDTKELNVVRFLFENITYPQIDAIKTQAQIDALIFFSNYLDLLQNAAKPQPSRFDRVLGGYREDLTKSVADNAKDLAEKAESVRKKYNDIAEHVAILPKINGVTDDNLTKELGAIGGVVNVLNQIAESDGSVELIRKIVNTKVDENDKENDAGTPRWKRINGMISELGTEVVATMKSTFVSSGLANERIRAAYQNDFRTKKGNLIERSAILEKLKNYPIPTSEEYKNLVSKDLEKIISETQNAHEKLIEVLNNPTAADRRAEAKAGLKTLEILIGSFIQVVAIYK